VPQKTKNRRRCRCKIYAGSRGAADVKSTREAGRSKHHQDDKSGEEQRHEYFHQSFPPPTCEVRAGMDEIERRGLDR
jgi:hypothetical protein